MEYLNSIQADLYHKYGEVLDTHEDISSIRFFWMKENPPLVMNYWN